MEAAQGSQRKHDGDDVGIARGKTLGASTSACLQIHYISSYRTGLPVPTNVLGLRA